jgi:hypothetical protein
MYRTCIFCSKDLGSNEVIEHFPVGSRLAFDSHKGRLWAVCPRCLRWNLAPIEERWEAVEEAESKFRSSRMRVQSENIGMAKMPDGTRLIRVGSALPGELAAWRYGSQLVKRRTGIYLAIGAGVATGAVVLAGAPLLLGVGVPMSMVNPVIQMVSFGSRVRASSRVVMQLPAEVSPDAAPLLLRRRDLHGAHLTHVDGTLAVSIPEPVLQPWYKYRSQADPDGPRIVLEGPHAQTLAARAMVDYNSRGARQREVNEALDLLQRAGSAQAFIEQIGAQEPTIAHASQRARNAHAMNGVITPRRILGSFRGERIDVRRQGYHPGAGAPHALARIDGLALEMALHDESERRALEGELDLLEDAWREAESIARIADALPDEPPED